jgi:serine/threonine protein kinase
LLLYEAIGVPKVFGWLKSKPVAAPIAVGHYTITKRLGAGGMGVVYAARDERLGRNVAIKMIHEAAPDPRARERLWREARSAAQLSHPNICQVYEVGELRGEPYIVMELLEGESLAHVPDVQRAEEALSQQQDVTGRRICLACDSAP